MQLPQRDPNGRVPVRRLWSGAIARVPSGLAVRMVLAGEAVPVFAENAVAPSSGSVVDVLRASLRNDAELYALMVAARAYALHGAGPGMDAQRRAGERLRRITGGLPRTLCPVSYSIGMFTKTFGPEPAGGWYAAPEALSFRGSDRKAA